MSKDMPSAEFLGAIEDALVRHRAFGDSAYIVGQLEVAFKRRLDRVAFHMPSARTLLEAFESADDDTRHRIAGNTVIRVAVQHAHTQFETDAPYGLPIPDCDKVFETTAHHLRLGKTGTPLENGAMQLHRLGPEPYHGWIWADDYPDDVFGRSFRHILDFEYGDPLCTITEEERARLGRGERLLNALLPSLARSALGHAHLVGIFSDIGFWKGRLSSSQIRMGGTIFLNRQMLRSPWCVAEHLLHESLHQKLYDFRHGHSLLDPDFADPEPPRVCSLWNAQELNKANHWDTHRAFAAFHVYVQLSLLATVAEQRAPELEAAYGPNRGMIESRKAMERARYLGEKLGELCADELGVAGKRLLDWLMTVLNHLDPAPPPRGAYIHLLLDLYEREANKIETVFRGGEAAHSSLARQLRPVAKAEVDGTRRVLTAINAMEELDRFEDTIGRFTDDQLGLGFPMVRRAIARTILAASPDGYALVSRAPVGTDPDVLVRQMVEAGSERLYLIQENVPPPVAGAKRRAKDLRFAKSCEDKVGRLLAVLAAAVPPGGRILEIGTGVGVGLAWIVTGLAGRDDVEVVSIEADPRLSTAAAVWPWPGFVQILTDDAMEALPKAGTFNLVFADAAPVKYGNIGLTLGTLRPGGMLVIDDLYSGPATTKLQQAEKDALRLSLLDHPDLRLVELDWSSRIILATRSVKAADTVTEPKMAVSA
jgi:predicted O-methyltransferase YrrM